MNDTEKGIMPEVLDKESPVALPLQLKRILQQRIETAYYTPGRKIDSVRKISAIIFLREKLLRSSLLQEK